MEQAQELHGELTRVGKPTHDATRGNPKEVAQQLIKVLNEIGHRIDEKIETRDKVLYVVRANHLLKNLGVSVAERPEGDDYARDRLRHYFKQYVRQPIHTDELQVVGGIIDYQRRIRELRVQEGYPVLNGFAFQNMIKEGELEAADFPEETRRAGINDYILLRSEPDEDKAERWKKLNTIRRKKVAVKDKLLEYLLVNVGEAVAGDELDYVAGDSKENKRSWPRRARELRTEDGWQVKTRYTGRPDLPAGFYVLESDRQSLPHDRHISDAVRKVVLKRDEYSCRKCGWNRENAHPDDPSSFLELHHVEHHVKGGTNEEDNLLTLCNVCHDQIHGLGLVGNAAFAWLNDGADAHSGRLHD